MNSKLATRLMMITTTVALLAATAVAQQPPAGDKPNQEVSAAAKQEPVASAVKPTQETAATAKTTQDATVADKVQAGDPTIHSRTDKISYAFGVDMARDLQRQKNSLNVDLLMRALTDALAGKKLIMSDEEVAATVKTFEADQKRDFQHAKMMIAEHNRREGEAFFAENVKKEGVVTLPSGLQYKILHKGDGKLPTLEDVVVCNYTGKLLDGTEIDSSFKRKEPTALPVKGVIPGWTQALQLMPVGTKWEMYIPPQLAYADRWTPTVGPNATLIFEVELLSIQDKAQTASAAR